MAPFFEAGEEMLCFKLVIQAWLSHVVEFPNNCSSCGD